MADLDDLSGAYRRSGATGDQAIAVLAARQHGVVATWQLTTHGYSISSLARRARAGRLHRLHLGVYAVGHRRISSRGRWMAAVLACGPDALLSHRAAATLWELRPPPGGPVDVTVSIGHRRGQRGVRAHNVRALDEQDRATLDGIPTTSLPRTLLDYAEVARPQQLRLALEAAERRDLLDGGAIDALIGRCRGRRGLKPLKAALAQMRGPAPWTQSELENHFLALIRAAGIPEPSANVDVDGFVVDLFWPQQRLVVEVDSYRFHRSRQRFEADRLKDTKLQLAGCRVLRATQARIESGPRELVSDVLRALDAGGSDR